MITTIITGIIQIQINKKQRKKSNLRLLFFAFNRDSIVTGLLPVPGTNNNPVTIPQNVNFLQISG